MTAFIFLSAYLVEGCLLNNAEFENIDELLILLLDLAVFELDFGLNVLDSGFSAILIANLEKLSFLNCSF